jgi:hypothetical protein
LSASASGISSANSSSIASTTCSIEGHARPPMSPLLSLPS